MAIGMKVARRNIRRATGLRGAKLEAAAKKMVARQKRHGRRK